MSESITTAADLAALPPAEVIRRGWTGYTDAEPVPVKPSRGDVARAINPAAFRQANGVERLSVEAARRDAFTAADAVLALLPGRTEAEVKAEALEEAADSPAVWGVLANSLHVSGVRSWLRHRAAALLRGESNG